MRLYSLGLLLVANFCWAQVVFVPSRPGNWTPTTPIFGVWRSPASDTIYHRSIKNLNVDSIRLEEISMEILSPGLEGEWGNDVHIDGPGYVNFRAKKESFVKMWLPQFRLMAPNAIVGMTVLELFDCDVYCTVDETVTPPDTLSLHNTANPVDTMDARLGLYWRNMKTNHHDSSFLDCRIEFRPSTPGEGVQSRGGSLRRPPVGSSDGWKVDGKVAWNLRRLDGTTVPLGHQTISDGLMLQPTQPFAGVGILSNSQGQSYRVVGVR